METTNDSTLAAAVRELLAQLQRRRRRFWIGAAVVLLALLAASASVGGGDTPADSDHVARIDVTGPILAEAETNADWVIGALGDAFDTETVKAVVLYINSPGGSAVQSARIHRELIRLRDVHPEMPVIAVADDVCASGAYYVAAAADTIYANEASLIGSIGVIAAGFGFDQFIAEYNIERRVISAPEGGQKAMLDPFQAEDPEAVAYLQSVLDEVHDQFRIAVITGRGERLVDDAQIFDGRFYSGIRAQELGLIDEFGDIGDVTRELGVDEVVAYGYEEPLVERLLREGVGTPLEQWLRPFAQGLQF